MTSTTTLTEAPRETSGRVADELLDAALLGDLRRAEHLLTTASPSIWTERSGQIGAALLRILGYGDAAGARHLLALADDRSEPGSGAHRVASAVLALVVGGAEWERWEARVASSEDPAAQRLVDLRRGAAAFAFPGRTAPGADRQVIDALAAIWEPENAWRPEFSPADATSHSALARTIRDLDLAARMIRDARWSGAHELLSVSAERAAAGGMRVLARAADGIRALALALAGEDERAVVLARAVLGDRVTRELPGTTFAAWHAILHVAVKRRDEETARVVLAASARRPIEEAVYPSGWLWDVSDAVALSPSSEPGPARLREASDGRSIDRSVAFADRFLTAAEAAAPNTGVLGRLIDAARGEVGNYELARALHRLAEIQLAEGLPADARRSFAEAAVEFSVSGAGAWAVRASASRDRVGRPNEAARAALVVMRLTEQEERIVALAARGYSNKEIGQQLYLSPRTVGGHLYNAFPKLGVTSRAALRDALTMRDAMIS